MRKIIDYKRLSNADSTECNPSWLDSVVKKAIAAGWRPWGVPFEGNIILYQAMVKYEDVDKPKDVKKILPGL